jgi:hypothetical protein
MDQMDLPQIGLVGVTRHPGAVFDGPAQMRVTFDTEADQEPNAGSVRLAERVHRAAGDRNYYRSHSLSPSFFQKSANDHSMIPSQSGTTVFNG